MSKDSDYHYTHGWFLSNLFRECSGKGTTPKTSLVLLEHNESHWGKYRLDVGGSSKTFIVSRCASPTSSVYVKGAKKWTFNIAEGPLKDLRLGNVYLVLLCVGEDKKSVATACILDPELVRFFVDKDGPTAQITAEFPCKKKGQVELSREKQVRSNYFKQLM